MSTRNARRLAKGHPNARERKQRGGKPPGDSPNVVQDAGVSAGETADAVTENASDRASPAEAGGPRSVAPGPDTRQAWLLSEERRRAHSFARVMLLAFAVCSVAVLVLIQLITAEVVLRDVGYTIALALGLLGLGAYFYAIYTVTEARRRFDARRAVNAEKAVDAAAATYVQRNDLPSLMEYNRTRLERYQVISTSQAADSYSRSQFANFTGLVILVIGSGATIFAQADSSKAAAAALTAVGSLLSGYIGHTYMKAYDRSLTQLNFYFRQPFIDSYHLAAERVSMQLPESDRIAMLKIIVHEMLSATHSSGSAVSPAREPSSTPPHSAPDQ